MGVFRFGKFELNEEARALRLAGQTVEVQPLVFAFLAMLLRHQDRALSKDELLDALWPDVTVTESSLQRVASLARAVLRQGNLETAIRNLPRFGYRLCLDAAAGEESTSRTEPRTEPRITETRATLAASPDTHVLAGREAFAMRKWQEADTAFAKADAANELQTADLEDWAIAIECCGRPSDAIAPLTRAVAAFSMAGQCLRAVSPAVTLAKIHLEKGELAVANGWCKRATGLVGANQHSREDGLCRWIGARIAAAEGHTDQALDLAEQAYTIGRQQEDPVLESLGLIYRGFFKLCLGETEAGLEDQDFAAAMGLSSDIDPVAGGIIYCNILWVCRNFGDWARANQWTEGYERFCRDSGLADISGACRLHRAEVLSVHGTLKEAETRIQRALGQLAADAPWARGDALRVLGDIYLATGDLAAAQSAYQGSHAVGWDPQPGLALLQLAQGQGEAAYQGLERSLLGTSWPALQRRGLMLATLAKVAARIGRIDRAQEIIAELETQPRRWPMPAIRALTAEAKAALAAKDGRIADAMSELQTACRLWNEVESAVNCADVRLTLAELLIQSGDRRGAEMEIGTALAIAGKVDSPRLLRRCEELSALLAA